MDLKDKYLAETILNHLCKDKQIAGVRFGAVLQVLISNDRLKSEKPIQGQIYLNLSSTWKVFDSRPLIFPDGEDEIEEIPQQEEIQIIYKLRARRIKHAELGAEQPHLILTLDDDRVVFINGKHEMYECWDLGVACSSDRWLVVACPGGGIALWFPDSFNPSKEIE